MNLDKRAMPTESLPTFENNQERFKSFIEKGIEAALAKIKKRFEEPFAVKDRLPYHNTNHTKDVIRRTVMILQKIRQAVPHLVKERDISLGGLAASYHDTVQDWEEHRLVEGEFSKVIRKRFVGQNEKTSAEEAIAFMNEANQESGEELFSEADKIVVREAIIGTIPGFDPDKKTVIQPHLPENASLVARAVALADLGAAGMDGASAYLAEGDALFREENLDILEALSNPAKLDDPALREYFRKRMIDWSNFQEAFAAGRKALLQAELAGIPEEARSEVEGLFNKFDESLKAASIRAEKRKTMTFKELAVDMGYVL